MNLVFPVPSFELSTESANEVLAIRDAHAELVAARDRHKDQVEALKNLGDWSPDINRRAEALREQDITLLNQELSIRERLHRQLERFRDVDQPAARAAARAALKNANDFVYGKLVEAGFIDGMVADRIPGIDLQWLNHHPAVREATVRVNNADRFDVVPALNDNKTQGGRLREKVQQALNKAVSAL